MSIIGTRLADTLTSLWSGLAVGPEPAAFPGHAPTARRDTMDSLFQFTTTPADRRAEMLFYDYLQTELSDVTKALSAYATMATTGSLVGGGKGSFKIRSQEGAVLPDELVDRLSGVEEIFRRHAFTILRGMTKYGSYPAELDIVPRGPNGRGVGIGNIKHVPPATLQRIIGQNGSTDPKEYWEQVIKGRRVATLPQWRMPHFSVWTDVVRAEETLLYGTSILKPFGRIGLQVGSTIDSMVVARLSRAAMRYVWKVDVSDIKDDAPKVMERLERWRVTTGRAGKLLSDGGVNTYKRAPVPDEDLYVPSGEGLEYGVDKIEGDTNLGNIDDVRLLLNIYFGALGVPPEYLGHERSQGGRSTLSQIDINFARSSRHLQLFACAGLEHMAYVEMILAGYDPNEYPIEGVPPNIGARDDLLQAQVRALQSQVVANLRAAGMDFTLEPAWVLKTFMNLDEDLEPLTDEVLKKLFATAEVVEPDDEGGKFRRGSTEMLQVMARDTEALIQNIKMLVATDQAATSFDGLPDYRYGHPTGNVLRQSIGL